MVDCATTRRRRKATSLKFNTDLPLNTLIGWNDDNKAAGYSPFIRKEINKVEPKIIHTIGESNGCAKSLPVKLRNQGMAISIRASAIKSEITLTASDSDINCPNNCIRSAPTILRMLTSFDLRLARAVVKFT